MVEAPRNIRRLGIGELELAGRSLGEANKRGPFPEGQSRIRSAIHSEERIRRVGEVELKRAARQLSHIGQDDR